MKIKDALDTINPDRDLIVRTELLIKAGRQRKKISFYKSVAVAAGLLFIMSALSLTGYAYYQTPQCYIDVDINPSMELGINAFDRVVDVTYFNDNAQELIGESSLKGRRTGEAVGLIIGAADDGGYIGENGETVVSLALVGGSSEKSQSVLQECADSVKKAHGNVAVFQASLSSGLKSEADAASMSAGKLNLIKMIQELDSAATVEDYKGDSIAEIFDRLAYLTSDENTEASEESKKAVRSGISGVTEQMEQMKNNNGGNNKNSGETGRGGDSVQENKDSKGDSSGLTGNPSRSGASSDASLPSSRQDDKTLSQGSEGNNKGGNSQSGGQKQGEVPRGRP